MSTTPVRCQHDTPPVQPIGDSLAQLANDLMSTYERLGRLALALSDRGLAGETVATLNIGRQVQSVAGRIRWIAGLPL